MNRMLSPVFRSKAIFICGFLAATANACPVCYGASDSPMAAGMNVAILTMVGIISVVLSGIVAFYLMMRRRLRRFEALTDSEFTEHN